MALYLFHIADVGTLYVDDRGLELMNDEAAMMEAKAAAVDLLRDAMLRGEGPLELIIEVRASNRLVGRVMISTSALR